MLNQQLQLQEDQKQFIKLYIDQALEGKVLSKDEIDEMESVLYSVSYGKQDYHKKVGYQAFSAAISHFSHVDLVLNYICRKDKVRQAKCKIIAYRVSQPLYDGEGNLASEEQDFDGGSSQQQSEAGTLTEGFDDGGEEGCGQKLLHLLQKMGVENILIIVCVWHHRMHGQFGTDTYKMVLERGKELLSNLHLKVLEAERLQQEQAKQSQALVPYQPSDEKGKSLRKNMRATQQNGIEVTTKVYPSNIIPDKKEVVNIYNLKKNYRPNNFMSEGGMMANRVASLGRMQDELDENLEIELTEDEFNYAVKMTEHSIRRLTKAHIIELRNQVKPHHLVEKVLNMVCILRGCIAPNWTMAREMMASMTFKMELMLMDVCQVKQSLIKRVIKILNTYQKQLTPDALSQISDGATILLTWIINLVKWNAGHTKYKFDENVLSGHKNMNNALQNRASDGGDENMDIQDSVNDEYHDKANTYGIMLSSNPQHVISTQGSQDSSTLQQLQSKGQKGNTKQKTQKGAHINVLNQQLNKQGTYLQGKQMIFGNEKMLQPLKEQIDRAGSMGQIGDHTLQSQLVKQYTNTQKNQQQVNQQQQQSQFQTKQQHLEDMINLLQSDKKNNWEDLKAQIPENEEEILKFLDTAVLEEQPTEILVQLAQKLKERRNKLYQEEMMQQQQNSQMQSIK